MLSSKAKRELKIDQRQILIDSIEIGIASPQQIYLRGSRQLPNGKKVGLIKNSKTVNYKRFTPFRDGLFCERIFGPVTSFVCACGKKQPHNKVTFCEKCEVEYIDQRSRRYRLGYISLLSPVTHIWYLKGRPSYLSLFLGKRKKSVVSLAYCNAYLIEHIPFQKEDERQVWPFIPSLFKTGNLLQNNLSKYKPNRLLTGSARTSNLSKYLPGYVNWSWAQKTKSLTQEYARTRKQTIFANKFDLQVGDLHSLAYTEHSARKIFSRPLQPRTLLCPKNTRAVRTQLGLNGLCKSRIYVNSSKRLFTPIAIQHKSKICEVPLLAPKEHGNRNKKGHVCIKTKSPDLNTLDASFRRNDRSFLQNYANSFAGMQKETCKAVSRFCVTSSKRKVKWVSHARTCNLCTNLRTRLSTLRVRVDLSPAVIECKYSGLCSKGTERVRFVKCSKDSLTRVRLAQPLRKSSVLNCEGINVTVDHTNPWHVLCRATQLEDLCCTAYKPKVCRARRVTSQIEDLCCTVKKAFGKHFAPSQQTVTMSNRRLALSQRCICRSTNSLRIRNTDNFYTESYAKYSYTRQQCLPFLPSFASHFYLRDALLNFIYSAPASDDIPLSEYCKTSRVEPLQDVHKFMARQTVERLKGVGSLTFATSPPTEGHTNLRFASVEDAKIKNFHTSSLPCSCMQGPCSYPSLLRRSIAIGARARRCNFLLRKSMAIVARRGLQTEGLYVHLLDLAPKEHGHSNTRFWCKRAIRDSQKFVRGLPEFDLKTYVLRNLKGDSHKSICKTYCKSKQTRFDFAPSMSLGTKVKNTPRLRRFVWRTYKPKVCTCKTHRHTSECNQLLRKKSQAYVKNIQQSTLTKTKNLINQTLNEDNNTALSNLELTAIREILSYTGGGALQHLLKQFDPHDLCKFLVAEKQILRVLYQNHIASLVSFESDTQKSQILTRPLSPSVNDPFLNDAKAKAISPLLGLQNGLCQTLLTPLKKHNITCKVKTFCAPGYSCIKDATTFTSFTSQIEDLLTMQIEPKLSKPLDNIDTARQVQDSARLSKNKVLYAQYTGNPLGLPWELKSKTKQLYQKKEIVRISRRIYKVVRRLKVAQLLTLNHRRPEWMILSHLPVLPPDLRPILQMSEKVIVASDLNIMYQRVIYRNNRHLRVRFIDFQLVTAIQRLVQDAVDRLMENGKGGSKPYYTQGGRPLKSLSDILKGKKGRFRLNLLGKRVDFSGRSVIVVAPSLKIHECGLPKDIALELYHYFLLRQLIVKKYCASIVTAKKMIKSKSSQMWDILREVMYHHPVLLNRAPTLHRLGIQAFQPKLVVGNAIWLHPLVCSGFNADFDGDQMGVHLPLSFAARSESWDLLWSRNNLLSPATGQPMLVPSQDMVLGFYYMTAQGFANRFMNGIKSKTDYLKIGDTVNRNARTFCTSSHSTILKSSSRLNLRARTCLTPIVPIDMPYSCPYSFGARAIGVRRGMAIGAKKGAAIGTNNSFVFVNTTAIITNFQNGNIRLHTPVWLNWAGEIENENTSATPFELRVHGLGSQRYIYENLISSDLFTNTNSLYTDCSEDTRTLNQRSVHDSCVPKQIAQGRTRAFTKISFIRGGRAKLGTHLTTNTMPPFALKTHDNKVEASKACTQIEGLQSTSHKSLAPGFPLQNNTTPKKSKIDASFICTQAKASYVRTTAGRVLMNNILKA